MTRRNISYASILAIMMVLLLQDDLHAQRASAGSITNAVRREYNEYIKRISFVRNAMEKERTAANKKSGQFNDEEGVMLVSDILQYKGIRRHSLKAANDAEQLLIEAIEIIKSGDYDKAFLLTKEAVSRDGTYMRAHLLLAGLYERRGDIKNMEKEYRYDLKKTLFLRKMMEEKTGWPDIELKFIEEKFNRYKIPLKDPTLTDINTRYIVIGAIYVTMVILVIIVLLINASKETVYPKKGGAH